MASYKDIVLLRGRISWDELRPAWHVVHLDRVDEGRLGDGWNVSIASRYFRESRFAQGFDHVVIVRLDVTVLCIRNVMMLPVCLETFRLIRAWP